MPAPSNLTACLRRAAMLAAWLSAATALRAEPIALVPAACGVSGVVSAAGTPLPGVVVTLTSVEGEAAGVTSSGVDGRYLVRAQPGRYTLKAELVAFASVAREIAIAQSTCGARVDLTMALASRAAAAGRPAANGSIRRQTRGPNGPATQPYQNLAVLPDAALAADGVGEATDTAAQLLLPTGFSADAAAETVTAFGSGRPNDVFVGSGDRFSPFGRGDDLPFGRAAGFAAGGGRGGGPGAFGDGGGGFGGPGGPVVIGRFGANRVRGSLFQSVDASGLDAAPFSLTGQASAKPDSLQQRFGATLGGPLTIPKLFDAGARTFFFLNYTGNHSRTPYDAYSTVPTAALRSGDLSSLGRAIIDPSTNQPFAGSQIPAARLDPAAQALLALMPLPNQAGDRQNFHNVTTTSNQLDDINLRVVRTFEAEQQPGRPRQQGIGGRGAFGGERGGPGRRAGTANLNVSLHYRHADAASQNPFPALGGTTTTTAWDIPVGYSFTKGGALHALRFGFNRQRTDTTNLFAFNQNVAAAAGLLGVSSDPFDWGAPNLSFTTFTGLRDLTPSTRIDRTIAIGDSVVKTFGAHTVRFGGDYRDVRFDSRTDANARGTFVFTGLYTGVDFADFLLGLPQQATAQYGPGLERFGSHAMDLFVQDDWRWTNDLTVNLGLRYEYYAPYAEADDRLATLDVTPTFTAAVPVVGGSTGPFAGALPETLVRPDRNNFAPRVGVAWKAQAATTVRAGYGINYSTSVYQTIAQQLAAQPPFAVADTVLASAEHPVSLESALAAPASTVTANTFGVDPNYRLGFVQIWNVDLQRDLARTYNVGVGYTGTHGTNLDVLRAPNRNADGSLRIAGVAPFIWESSAGDSIMHALTLRLRRRLTNGFGGGVIYTLSKSIDDASSIGGVGALVAQNDLDLAAERGLSSFDQRHRVTGDLTYELPFGENRRWVTDGAGAALLGGWVVSATLQVASGTPFTARVLGAIGDVATGVNGTLRANDNGDPITVSNPTVARFFNTAAFSIPSPGTYGDAGRNTIVGPGTTNLNLGVTRNITFGARVLSIQVVAANVLNTVQFGSIDTIVNSPIFGQVIATRPMRRVQIVARFRF